MDSAPQPPYDPSGLQSLLGYGAKVPEASGGICQLCGFGGGRTTELGSWLQLTVEDLIGQGQSGYPPRIRPAIARRFPQASSSVLSELANSVHPASMVSACQFCNSTTSRDVAPRTMEQVIADTPGDAPEEFLMALAAELQPILERKRASVARQMGGD